MVVPPVSIITRVLSYIRLQSVVLTRLGYSPKSKFNSAEHANDATD